MKMKFVSHHHHQLLMPIGCSRLSQVCLLSLSIFVIILAISAGQSDGAPALNQQLGKYKSATNSSYRDRGCYYMLQHYKNGDQIKTDEPCLNCTCENSMLMCYLRVCPYVKPVGDRCIIERVQGECCPRITCPDVPPQLEQDLEPETVPPTTTTTTTTTPSTIERTYANETTSSSGGCMLNGVYYHEGAQMPSDEGKPCEVCYCIRNHASCVMQDCALDVSGCAPVYQSGGCCPTRYNCSAVNAFTTPRPQASPMNSVDRPGRFWEAAAAFSGQKSPNFITSSSGKTDSSSVLSTTTTTLRPIVLPDFGRLSPSTLPPPGCRSPNSTRILADGEKVPSKNKCEHCYCMRHEIVCAIQECRPPCDGCTPIMDPTDECCPKRYECAAPTVRVPTDNIIDAAETSTLGPDPKQGLDSTTATSTAVPSGDQSSSTTISSDAITSSSTTTVQPDENSSTLVTASELSKLPEVSHMTTRQTKPPLRPISPKISNDDEAAANDLLPDLDSTRTNGKSDPNNVDGFNVGGEREQDIEPNKSIGKVVAAEGSQPMTGGQQGQESNEMTILMAASSTPAPEGSFSTSSGTTTAAPTLPTMVADNLVSAGGDKKLRPSVVPSTVPGEGHCRYNGKIYQNGQEVKSKDTCMEICMCINSVVYCDEIDCPKGPETQDNCERVMVEGECCPKWVCHDNRPVDAATNITTTSLPNVDTTVNFNEETTKTSTETSSSTSTTAASLETTTKPAEQTTLKIQEVSPTSPSDLAPLLTEQSTTTTIKPTSGSSPLEFNTVLPLATLTNNGEPSTEAPTTLRPLITTVTELPSTDAVSSTIVKEGVVLGKEIDTVSSSTMPQQSTTQSSSEASVITTTSNINIDSQTTSSNLIISDSSSTIQNVSSTPAIETNVRNNTEASTQLASQNVPTTQEPLKGLEVWAFNPTTTSPPEPPLSSTTEVAPKPIDSITNDIKQNADLPTVSVSIEGITGSQPTTMIPASTNEKVTSSSAEENSTTSADHGVSSDANQIITGTSTSETKAMPGGPNLIDQQTSSTEFSSSSPIVTDSAPITTTTAASSTSSSDAPTTTTSTVAPSQTSGIVDNSESVSSNDDLSKLLLSSTTILPVEISSSPNSAMVTSSDAPLPEVSNSPNEVLTHNDTAKPIVPVVNDDTMTTTTTTTSSPSSSSSSSSSSADTTSSSPITSTDETSSTPVSSSSSTYGTVAPNSITSDATTTAPPTSTTNQDTSKIMIDSSTAAPPTTVVPSMSEQESTTRAPQSELDNKRGAADPSSQSPLETTQKPLETTTATVVTLKANDESSTTLAPTREVEPVALDPSIMSSPKSSSSDIADVTMKTTETLVFTTPVSIREMETVTYNPPNTKEPSSLINVSSSEPSTSKPSSQPMAVGSIETSSSSPSLIEATAASDSSVTAFTTTLASILQSVTSITPSPSDQVMLSSSSDANQILTGTSVGEPKMEPNSPLENISQDSIQRESSVSSQAAVTTFGPVTSTYTPPIFFDQKSSTTLQDLSSTSESAGSSTSSGHNLGNVIITDENQKAPESLINATITTPKESSSTISSEGAFYPTEISSMGRESSQEATSSPDQLKVKDELNSTMSVSMVSADQLATTLTNEASSTSSSPPSSSSSVSGLTETGSLTSSAPANTTSNSEISASTESTTTLGSISSQDTTRIMTDSPSSTVSPSTDFSTVSEQAISSTTGAASEAVFSERPTTLPSESISQSTAFPTDSAYKDSSVVGGDLQMSNSSFTPIGGVETVKSNPTTTSAPETSSSTPIDTTTKGSDTVAEGSITRGIETVTSNPTTQSSPESFSSSSASVSSTAAIDTTSVAIRESEVVTFNPTVVNSNPTEPNSPESNSPMPAEITTKAILAVASDSTPNPVGEVEVVTSNPSVTASTETSSSSPVEVTTKGIETVSSDTRQTTDAPTTPVSIKGIETVTYNPMMTKEPSSLVTESNSETTSTFAASSPTTTMIPLMSSEVSQPSVEASSVASSDVTSSTTRPQPLDPTTSSTTATSLIETNQVDLGQSNIDKVDSSSPSSSGEVSSTSSVTTTQRDSAPDSTPTPEPVSVPTTKTEAPVSVEVDQQRSRSTSSPSSGADEASNSVPVDIVVESGDRSKLLPSATTTPSESSSLHSTGSTVETSSEQAVGREETVDTLSTLKEARITGELTSTTPANLVSTNQSATSSSSTSPPLGDLSTTLAPSTEITDSTTVASVVTVKQSITDTTTVVPTISTKLVEPTTRMPKLETDDGRTSELVTQPILDITQKPQEAKEVSSGSPNHPELTTKVVENLSSDGRNIVDSTTISSGVREFETPTTTSSPSASAEIITKGVDAETIDKTSVPGREVLDTVTQNSTTPSSPELFSSTTSEPTTVMIGTTSSNSTPAPIREAEIATVDTVAPTLVESSSSSPADSMTRGVEMVTSSNKQTMDISEKPIASFTTTLANILQSVTSTTARSSDREESSSFSDANQIMTGTSTSETKAMPGGPNLIDQQSSSTEFSSSSPVVTDSAPITTTTAASSTSSSDAPTTTTSTVAPSQTSGIVGNSESVSSNDDLSKLLLSSTTILPVEISSSPSSAMVTSSDAPLPDVSNSPNEVLTHNDTAKPIVPVVSDDTMTTTTTKTTSSPSSSSSSSRSSADTTSSSPITSTDETSSTPVSSSSSTHGTVAPNSITSDATTTAPPTSTTNQDTSKIMIDSSTAAPPTTVVPSMSEQESTTRAPQSELDNKRGAADPSSQSPLETTQKPLETTTATVVTLKANDESSTNPVEINPSTTSSSKTSPNDIADLTTKTTDAVANESTPVPVREVELVTSASTITRSPEFMSSTTSEPTAKPIEIATSENKQSPEVLTTPTSTSKYETMTYSPPINGETSSIEGLDHSETASPFASSAPPTTLVTVPDSSTSSSPSPLDQVVSSNSPALNQVISETSGNEMKTMMSSSPSSPSENSSTIQYETSSYVSNATTSAIVESTTKAVETNQIADNPTTLAATREIEVVTYKPPITMDISSMVELGSETQSTTAQPATTSTTEVNQSSTSETSKELTSSGESTSSPKLVTMPTTTTAVPVAVELDQQRGSSSISSADATSNSVTMDTVITTDNATTAVSTESSTFSEPALGREESVFTSSTSSEAKTTGELTSTTPAAIASTEQPATTVSNNPTSSSTTNSELSSTNSNSSPSTMKTVEETGSASSNTDSSSTLKSSPEVSTTTTAPSSAVSSSITTLAPELFANVTTSPADVFVASVSTTNSVSFEAVNITTTISSIRGTSAPITIPWQDIRDGASNSSSSSSLEQDSSLRSNSSSSLTSTEPPVSWSSSSSSTSSGTSTSDSDYEEVTEESGCEYEGKTYNSAQQIPRSHPCDFCFCFRGDIICLQQTCPPPVPHCFETVMDGFCCPRYECPVHTVRQAINSTGLALTPFETPQSRLTNSQSSSAQDSNNKLSLQQQQQQSNAKNSRVKGCFVDNKLYPVDSIIESASGPCLDCRCDRSGMMKCTPKECQPEDPLLQQINREVLQSTLSRSQARRR